MKEQLVSNSKLPGLPSIALYAIKDSIAGWKTCSFAKGQPYNPKVIGWINAAFGYLRFFSDFFLLSFDLAGEGLSFFLPFSPTHRVPPKMKGTDENKRCVHPPHLIQLTPLFSPIFLINSNFKSHFSHPYS
jgi:hypothetical protein